jgi:hypothetical protein
MFFKQRQYKWGENQELFSDKTYRMEVPLNTGKDKREDSFI